MYDLSVISLQRSIRGGNSSEVISELAEYFANLIFKLVDIPIDSEIPLEKIREVIKYL